MNANNEVYVPHLGWLQFPEQDEVANFIREGWYEYQEQAFLWLFIRPGDVFFDCGAHVGLYSVLVGKVAHSKIEIFCIEPDPNALPLLRDNLTTHHLGKAEIIDRALYSTSDTRVFFSATNGKTAYSSLVCDHDDSAQLEVATVTLDEILHDRNIDQVDFLKLDVEGAELDVLEGAKDSIANGRMPLVMFECTEMNLQATGKTTRDLLEGWRSEGYDLCRFNDSSLQLEPFDSDETIWYENIFAAIDVKAINRRLSEAEKESRRIAKDIIGRGGASRRMYDAIDRYRHVITRYHSLEKELSDFRAAKRQIESEISDLREAKQGVELANERLQREKERLEQKTARLGQELSVLETEREIVVSHLRSLLNSRWLRFGWRLGLSRRPDWVAECARDERNCE